MYLHKNNFMYDWLPCKIIQLIFWLPCKIILLKLCVYDCRDLTLQGMEEIEILRCTQMDSSNFDHILNLLIIFSKIYFLLILFF